MSIINQKGFFETFVRNKLSWCLCHIKKKEAGSDATSCKHNDKQMQRNAFGHFEILSLKTELNCIFWTSFETVSHYELCMKVDSLVNDYLHVICIIQFLSNFIQLFSPYCVGVVNTKSGNFRWLKPHCIIVDYIKISISSSGNVLSHDCKSRQTRTRISK